MYGPVLYYDYTLHVLLLVTHTHLAVATILNTVSGQCSDTHETRHNIRHRHTQDKTQYRRTQQQYHR